MGNPGPEFGILTTGTEDDVLFVMVVCGTVGKTVGWPGALVGPFRVALICVRLSARSAVALALLAMLIAM